MPPNQGAVKLHLGFQKWVEDDWVRGLLLSFASGIATVTKGTFSHVTSWIHWRWQVYYGLPRFTNPKKNGGAPIPSQALKVHCCKKAPTASWFCVSTFEKDLHSASSKGTSLIIHWYWLSFQNYPLVSFRHGYIYIHIIPLCTGTNSEQQPPKDHKSLLPSQAIQLDIKQFDIKVQHFPADCRMVSSSYSDFVVPFFQWLSCSLCPSICLSGLNAWGVKLCCLEIYHISLQVIRVLWKVLNFSRTWHYFSYPWLAVAKWFQTSQLPKDSIWGSYDAGQKICWKRWFAKKTHGLIHFYFVLFQGLYCGLTIYYQGMLLTAAGCLLINDIAEWSRDVGFQLDVQRERWENGQVFRDWCSIFRCTRLM